MRSNIKLRVYPKLRHSPVVKDWEEVDVYQLRKNFKNYWPMLDVKIVGGYLECVVDAWFYNQYMQLYDHQVFKAGKWRNGILPINSDLVR